MSATSAPEQVRGRPEDGSQRERYRSIRGSLTISGWLHLPAARLRARYGRTPARPWIVPAAAGWLGRRIRSDWSVLELGSGRSTAWLARRAGRVLSFEDNEFWLDQAREQLRSAGADNAELRRLPIEGFITEISALSDDSFDLLVVDFLEAPPAVDRVEAVRVGRSKLRPGGYLLLDDSDRPAYAEAYELLAGWRQHRFVGVKDGWPTVCETTIFRRPGT